jgi:hypothetical protein
VPFGPPPNPGDEVDATYEDNNAPNDNDNNNNNSNNDAAIAAATGGGGDNISSAGGGTDGVANDEDPPSEEEGGFVKQVNNLNINPIVRMNGPFTGSMRESQILASLWREAGSSTLLDHHDYLIEADCGYGTEGN